MLFVFELWDSDSYLAFSFNHHTTKSLCMFTSFPLYSHIVLMKVITEKSIFASLSFILRNHFFKRTFFSKQLNTLECNMCTYRFVYHPLLTLYLLLFNSISFICAHASFLKFIFWNSHWWKLQLNFNFNIML